MTETEISKDISYFINGNVANRVIKFHNERTELQSIFVPNWRAKPHHWDGFCNVLNGNMNLTYFETREKPNTRFNSEPSNLENKHVAEDIIRFINSQNYVNYSLILCSYTIPIVVQQWEKIAIKPNKLVLICPITEVKLPRLVKLFSLVPTNLLPRLAKVSFELISRLPAFHPICKNHQNIFMNGNYQEMTQLQMSIRQMQKLKIKTNDYRKIDCPVMVVKTLKDKLHDPRTCDIIYDILVADTLYEVTNFKEAHGKEVAMQVNKFLI